MIDGEGWGRLGAVSPVVEVRDLTVRFGAVTALEGFDLTAPAGTSVALVGRNGAGKSTTLRVLAGVLPPTAGTVRVAGVDAVRDPGTAKTRVGYCPDVGGLIPRATPWEHLQLAATLRSLAPGWERRALDLLDRFDLGDVTDRVTASFSHGMGRRMSVLLAAFHSPDVLLLDEPFSSLDTPTRAALLTDLGAILRADRTTTVLVTHERGEALALADRVAVLMDGRLRQVDETARVFYAPVSEEVARFVGVETLVSGRVVRSDGGVTAVDADGRIVEVAAAAMPGAMVRLAIRPEDVTLEPAGAATYPSSARNAFDGVVVRIAASTHAMHGIVDVGFPLVAAVTARSVRELGLAPGARVCAVFTASAAHLITEGRSA